MENLIEMNGYTLKNVKAFKQFLIDNAKNFDPDYPQQFNAFLDDFIDQDSVKQDFELGSSFSFSGHAETFSYNREEIEDEDGNFTTIITF